MDHKSQAALKSYCHKVGKHLVCKKSTKLRLLSALQEELTDTARDCNTYEDIVARVGDPTETARQLQDSVSNQEYTATLKQTRRSKYAVISAVVLLSLFLLIAMATYVYHIRNLVPVYYTQEVYEGTSLPPGYTWAD